MSVSPIGFTGFTIIAASLSFALAAAYGAIIFLSAYFVSREWFLFAVVFLTGFSIAQSQDVVKRQDLYSDGNDIPQYWKIIGPIVNFVYFNCVLFVAIALGIAIENSIGGTEGQVVAIAILTIYGFWEIETRARGWPLSLGGIMIWLLVILYLAAWGTQAFIEWIRSARQEEVVDQLRNTRRAILRVTSRTDESPIYSTARRFTL